jgi:hypothetical protein
MRTIILAVVVMILSGCPGRREESPSLKPAAQWPEGSLRIVEDKERGVVCYIMPAITAYSSDTISCVRLESKR